MAGSLDVLPIRGVDGLVIDRFLGLNWQRTCKQTDEVRVGASEMFGVWWKIGVPLFWLAQKATVEYELLNQLQPQFTSEFCSNPFNKCAIRLNLRCVNAFKSFCLCGCRRISTERASWWAGELQAGIHHLVYSAYSFHLNCRLEVDGNFGMGAAAKTSQGKDRKAGTATLNGFSDRHLPDQQRVSAVVYSQRHAFTCCLDVSGANAKSCQCLFLWNWK